MFHTPSTELEVACPINVAPVLAVPVVSVTLPFEEKVPVAENGSSKRFEYTLPTAEPLESKVTVHVPESPPSKVPDQSPSN